MADYQPLIAKAVTGLEKNSPEARRAIYDRARTALVTQLRSVLPPLSEADITRERFALEDAIRKVEADTAPSARPDAPRRPPAPLSRPPGSPSSPPPRQPAGAAPFPPQNGSPQSGAPPSATARPSDPRPSEPGVKGFKDVVADAENLGSATAQAARSARETMTAAISPSDRARVEPRFAEPTSSASLRRRAPAPPPQDGGPPSEPPARPETSGRQWAPQMPAAPPPREDRQDASTRGYGRDDAMRRDDPLPPQSSGRGFAPPPPMPYGADNGGDRFDAPDMMDDDIPPRVALGSYRRPIMFGLLALLVLILAGLAYWQGPNVVAMFRSVTTVARNTATQQAARENPPSGRAKISDRVGGQSDTQRQGDQAAVAPVAQRVVLYEEDAGEPAGKSYVGRAVWRTEQQPPAPGLPPETVIRADIDIPDRGMSMKWSLRRNSDKTLPASHTIEIMFVLPPDFVHGAVANIPGILMKQSEQTRGVPLSGLAVKVTTGFFLIGLTAADADQQRNLSLLKERGWFDVPIVYTDGKRAILAVEKGVPGDRAFQDAFASWGQ